MFTMHSWLSTPFKSVRSAPVDISNFRSTQNITPVKWSENVSSQTSTSTYSLYIEDQGKKEETCDDEIVVKLGTQRYEYSSTKAFLVTSIGYIVGIGNVWTFPGAVIKNGGGAFLIPYIIMTVFVGWPLLLLELTIGKFSSQTLYRCWGFCPIIRGLGYGMLCIQMNVAIWYNMIITWSLMYLLDSLNGILPWLKCDQTSTVYCAQHVLWLNESECLSNNWTACQKSTPCNYKEACYGAFGTCKPNNKTDQIVVWNYSLAVDSGCKINDVALDYFFTHFNGETRGYGVTNLGPIITNIAVCYFICWVFVAVSLQWGNKIAEIVSASTTAIQYSILFVLFFRGIFLDGAENGMKYFLRPDFKLLLDIRVWKNAVSAMFFDFGIGQGLFVIISSHKTFHGNYMAQGSFILFMDAFTSFIAGLVIFSYVGSFTKSVGLRVEQLIDSGANTSFGVLLSSLGLLKESKIFHVMFFLMLCLFGTDSIFVIVEMTRTFIIEMIPRLSKYEGYLTVFVCGLFFIAGLPLTTLGGHQAVFYLAHYSGGWNTVLMGLIQLIAVSWVYKIERFTLDIELMIGSKMNPFLKKYLVICWKYLTPFFLICVLLEVWIDYEGMKNIPETANVIGQCITALPVVIVVAVGVYTFKGIPGSGIEKLKNALRPSILWGPAKIGDRRMATVYSSGLVIDPRRFSSGRQSRRLSRRHSSAFNSVTQE